MNKDFLWGGYFTAVVYVFYAEHNTVVCSQVYYFDYFLSWKRKALIGVKNNFLYIAIVFRICLLGNERKNMKKF